MARYIDRKRLIADIQGTVSNVCLESPYDAEWFTRLADRQKEIIDIIENAPTSDVVEVVRCKDCELFMEWNISEEGYHGHCYEKLMHCTDHSNARVRETDFCSYGKKVE